MVSTLAAAVLVAVTCAAHGQWTAVQGLLVVALMVQAGWLGRRGGPARAMARAGGWTVVGLLAGIVVWLGAQHAQQTALIGRQTTVLEVRLQGLSSAIGPRWGQQAQVLKGPVAVVGRPVWLTLPFEADAALVQAAQTWRPSSRCRLTVQLGPVFGAANPGTFDREKWLRGNGIAVQGEVRAGECQQADQAGLLAQVDGWRWALRQHFAGFASPARGVLLGLLTGDRALIDTETRQRYQQMGISHLLAISGPHVLFLAGLLAAGWVRLLDLFPHVYGRMERRRWQLPLWMLAVLGYALLAGWEVPAQRTALMAVLAGGALWWRVQWPVHRVLLVVAAILVVLSPVVVWSAAFWLSFAALGVLLAWSAGEPVAPPLDDAGGVPGRWAKIQAAAKALLHTQLAMTVLLLPLVLVFFGQFSWLGLLVNLLAIPLLGGVVLLLNLAGLLLWPLSVPLADAVWRVALWVLERFHGLLDGLAQGVQAHQGGLLLPLTLTMPAMLAAFALVVLWLLPRGLVSRLWSVPLAVLVLADRPVPTGTVHLTALDVPQAQGLVVQTAHHALLLDGGAAGSVDASGAGRSAQVLSALGVRRLDRLVLTHPHDERASGDGLALLGQRPVASVWTGQPDAHLPKASGSKAAHNATAVPVHRCQAGDSWTWDGVEFTVLAPFVRDWDDVGADDQACVWRIKAPANRPEQGGSRVLVLGRAGVLTQQVLLLTCADLRAEVLISGGQPVLPELLHAVQARHWVRLQSPLAYARDRGHFLGPLQADAAPSWQPDLEGAIRVQVDDQGATVTGRRAQWPWLLYPVRLESARNPFTGAWLVQD